MSLLSQIELQIRRVSQTLQYAIRKAGIAHVAQAWATIDAIWISLVLAHLEGETSCPLDSPFLQQDSFLEIHDLTYSY